MFLSFALCDHVLPQCALAMNLGGETTGSGKREMSADYGITPKLLTGQITSAQRELGGLAVAAKAECPARVSARLNDEVQPMRIGNLTALLVRPELGDGGDG